MKGEEGKRDMCEDRSDASVAARKLAEEMIRSADHYEMYCSNDKCFLIYGLMRDCGYQISKIIKAVPA